MILTVAVYKKLCKVNRLCPVSEVRRSHPVYKERELSLCTKSERSRWARHCVRCAL